MTSQSEKQTVAIYILPNISKSKGSQKMKFGQLIEYNMRKIFLEKSYTKCVGGTIPRPFSKKSKLSISLNQQSEVLYKFTAIRPKLCGNGTFPQNFQTRKLGETTVFFAVIVIIVCRVEVYQYIYVGDHLLELI